MNFAKRIIVCRVKGSEYEYRVEQDEISILPASGTTEDGVPERGDLSVQFLLQPQCSYSIKIKASLGGTFRRLLQLYGEQVPSMVICHLMLALSAQIKSVADHNYSPSAMTALLALAPTSVVPFVKISAMPLKKFDIYNDQQMLAESGMDLGILPIFHFFTWMPLTLLLTGGVWLGVIAAGNLLYNSVVRIFGASLGSSELIVDLAFTGLSKVPVVVAVALLGVAYSTCGVLALSLSVLYYFIILFDMYKEYVKKVILKMIPRLQEETPPDPPKPATAAATATNGTTENAESSTEAPETATEATETTTDATASTDANNEASSEGVVITKKKIPQSSESLGLQLHLTLLMLCLAASVIQLPTLITWAVRVKLGHAHSLVDPTFLPSVLCIMALAVLWQCNPVHGRVHYKAVGVTLHGISVLVLLFASISLYRLPYFIAAALVIVAVHQIFAPSKPTVEKEKTN